MIHTASGVGFPKDLDVDMERWIGKSAESGFQIRLFFQTMDVEKVLKRKLPRIGGCFATALDGCFGTMDAALNAPYSDNPYSTGILYYPDETVISFCKKANRLGLQIELHAIGDAAFDQATRALKAALDDFPREGHRHGIIHACLPTREGMRICAEYGIHIPLQTSFINWKQEPEQYLRDLLGEREEKLNPLRDFMKAGISFSAGSDAPCTSPDPMQWIHNACNHPVPGQSLTVAEALRMCTWHGCRASFDEKERGSLEAGKRADMAILSENPHNVPLEELNQVRVQRLLLAGKPYEKQRQSIPMLLLKGIFGKRKV
jgi:predicted amidohydrolase YtcJ